MGTTKIDSMSDIGRALASRHGEVYLKNFMSIIDLEESKVNREIRGGLSKDDYTKAQQKLRALASAKLIVKSIHLFHDSQ